MNVTDLYSGENRPNWAGDTYGSTILESRSYDFKIMNTRANGRDYEITPPRELVGESDLDRSLAVLIDA